MILGAARYRGKATPAKQASSRAEAAAIFHSLSEVLRAPRGRDVLIDLPLGFAIAITAGSWLYSQSAPCLHRPFLCAKQGLTQLGTAAGEPGLLPPIIMKPFLLIVFAVDAQWG